MNKGKFIVITGLDGSGTTSLAKILSGRDPQGVFMHTPDDIFSDIRNVFADKVREYCPSSHYHLYLSSVILASEIIKEKIKTHNIYCVRYLMDTVVSHRVLGLNVQLEYDLGYYQIIKPDLTIFIDIDEQIRQKRISKRGKGKLDKLLDNDCIRKKFIAEFDRFSDSLIKIPNSSSFDSLLDNALKVLENLKIS